MKRLARHIRLLGSLAALLFVLGSSGVVVIIHSCTMVPQMECCQGMSNEMNADCSNQSQLPGIPTLQSDMSCTTTTLVGGLTTNPGVVDGTRPVQKISVLVMPPDVCLSGVQALTSAVPIAPFAQSISPPAVEKHILNASLLI